MTKTCTSIDQTIQYAAHAFIARISSQYDLAEAVLFGCSARRTHRPDSDADIAVVLRGPHGQRADIAINMAGIAFDVMLETGLLIEALPLWEDEWAHPEHFNNPALIANIQRDGVRL
jgi:predicted nucleotidyltransferase